MTTLDAGSPQALTTQAFTAICSKADNPVHGAQRSEIVGGKIGQFGRFEQSFTMRLVDWVADAEKMLINQVHQEPDDLEGWVSPPLALILSGDGLYVDYRHSDASTSTKNWPRQNVLCNTVAPLDMFINEPLNVAVDVQFGKAGTAKLTASNSKGMVILAEHNIPIGYQNQKIHLFHKMGLYRFDAEKSDVKTRTIAFSNIQTAFS